MKYKKLILSLLSSFLLTLSFPNYILPCFTLWHSFFAWFALVPLLIAVEELSLKKTFFLSWLTGFLFFAQTLYWLLIFFSLTKGIIIIGALLLWAYLGLFLALWLTLGKWLEHRGKLPYFLSLPCLWVSLELLRSYLFTGFPWLLLAHSQYLFLPLLQVTNITGVYSLSFILVLFNVALYSAWREKKIVNLIIGGVVIGIAVGYGVWELRVPQATLPLRVGVVQGNVTGEKSWTAEYKKAVLRSYFLLSEKVADATLIVWPETTIPGCLHYDREFLDTVLNLTQEKKFFLLLGSTHFEEGKYYNSAFLLSPQREVLARYDKVHLVPFGEYIPFRRVFSFLNKILGDAPDYTPGSEYKILNLNNLKFGCLICFEAIFPEIGRAEVKKGAHFLVNITNDAWFGKTAAPYQHAVMSIFQAVQNKVPLIRAANTGVSLITDERGRILISTGIFEKAVQGKTVFLSLTPGSFYTRWGDLTAYLCLGVTLCFLCYTLTKRQS